jgi:hypothetical protein
MNDDVRYNYKKNNNVPGISDNNIVSFEETELEILTRMRDIL